MDLVPEYSASRLVALALAGGSGAALADGTMSGNGGLVVATGSSSAFRSRFSISDRG